MALGFGSYVVDGQRVPLQTQNAYAPQGYGPNVQAVPSTQPASIPPYVGGSFGAVGGYSGSSVGGDSEIGGYGTAGQNSTATAVAAHDPFHWRDSPVVPALLALGLGLAGLRIIHWRG